MSVIRAEAPRWARMRRPGDRVWLLAILGSAAVGVLLTVSMKYGIALLVALCYVPLVLTDVGWGLAIWIPLPFLAGISSMDAAGKAAGALVAVAWFGVLRQRRAAVRRAILENRLLFAAIASICLWVTLSTAWASHPSLTEKDLWHWYAVSLIFLVVASTINTRRLVQMVAAAFVVGAVLSVAYGLAGGVSGSQALNPAAESGRLGGATGDPNFLAAGVLAAMVLGAGLLVSVREVPRRLRTLSLAGLLLALVLLAVGLVLTQSRGGLVAALVGLAVAFIVFPGQRRWVLSVVLILVGVAAVGFALSPSALHRVTSAGNGSGRTDLWTVALRVTAAHPITGVGDANFIAVSRDYSRAPGRLTSAIYLIEQPAVVHETYLQFLSETGIVGLGLFITLAGACLRAGLLAARRFAALGDRAMEVMSRATVVALAGFLAASAFISAEVDQRLWVLLALGPVMLLLANNQARTQPGRPPGVR